VVKPYWKNSNKVIKKHTFHLLEQYYPLITAIGRSLKHFLEMPAV